jgi:nitrate reductase NapD
MNLSGILVMVPPDLMDDGIRALNELPGIEIYHTEPASGRIVVVQEADSVSAEVDGLRRIQQLPQVVLAELVYHYFEHDQIPLQEIPATMDGLEGLKRRPGAEGDRD